MFRPAPSGARSMYVPWQWRVAFPIVAFIAAALAVSVGYAWRAGEPLIAGASAGILAGLAFAIAWTMHRFVPWIALALLAFGCALLGALVVRSTTEILAAGASATLVFATWFVGYEVLFTGRFHRETVSPVIQLGIGTSKRALIVYHSAHHGFQRTLQSKLAEALAAEGWRIDMTTASVAAPSDIDAYDLIVLGTPSFNWIPARPITTYVRRLHDLRGKNFALIVSGGGMTEEALRRLRAQVEAAHGRVVEALELWVARPNLPRYGVTDPQAIMSKLGGDLARRLA